MLFRYRLFERTGAHRGTAVTREVFRASQNAQWVAEIVSLESSHCRFAQGSRQLWRFAETLICSPPSFVAGNRNAGRKRPLNTCRSYLFSCNSRSRLDQFWISGTTESDIMRKNCGTENIAVAMHCIDAIYHWDPEPALQGMRL